MCGIICYTTYLPEGEERNITFEELLLDSNWVEGRVECPEEIYEHVGDINHKLSAKQNYEFLLRAISKYPLRVVGSLAGNSSSDCRKDKWNEYCTDCYIAGKYQKELLELGYYPTIMKRLTVKALEFSEPDKAISWLKKMIAHTSEYYEIDDDTCSILIYRDSDACHHIPASFANELARSLRIFRQRVILWDIIAEEDCTSLAQFLQGKRFKAIIGIQTRLFLSTYLSGKEKGFVHDLVYGPKYNIVFDHPIGIRRLFDNPPNNYYVLVHDRNYQSFIRNYFPKVKDSFCFSPGATCLPDTQLKQYDIIFVGSYPNYRNILRIIYNMDGPYRILAVRFLHIMRRNPDYTAEKALHGVLDNYGIKGSDADFLNLLEALKCVTACISSYYREKTIQALLDAEIELHVYGNDWDTAPFAEHRCLRRHPTMDLEESLCVMKKAKISLNVMSWHKDGLTERILNSMLAGTVVVSDRTTHLEEEFVDGEDIILFNLANISQLPGRIKGLLSDDERLAKIAANGKKKVEQKHLWIHRAKELLGIISHHTE